MGGCAPGVRADTRMRSPTSYVLAPTVPAHRDAAMNDPEVAPHVRHRVAR